MSATVVLIADPVRAPLDARLVAELSRLAGGDTHWLAPEEAALIEITRRSEELDAALVRVRAQEPLDAVLLPHGVRRMALLISDMDSTMITIECIDELAEHAGIKPEIALITRRAMNGEIDFAAALRERVALLAGLPVGVIDEVIESRLRFMPGAKTLVRTMAANGARTALVSGGFTAFTAHVRDRLGFDCDVANELEIENGRLSGRIKGPLRDSGSKLETLHALCRQHGLAIAQSLAVGDGANDLPMIEAAGLGVGFRAHERVARAAPHAIRHGDLSALLFLQGYRRDTFVGAEAG